MSKQNLADLLDELAGAAEKCGEVRVRADLPGAQQGDVESAERDLRNARRDVDEALKERGVE